MKSLFETDFIDFFIGYAAGAFCLPRKTDNLFLEDNKMKKSHIAVILFSTMVAALSGFTGCNAGNPEGSESSISAPESTVNVIDSSDSADIPNSSESEPESTDGFPEQRLSGEQLEMISKLKIQSFVGPDGETVRAADASDVFDGAAPHDEIGSPGFKFDSKAFNDEAKFDADGNPISPERVSTVLRYDFAYIRYCRSLFYRGELLDDVTEQQMIDELPDNKWFKVKAGDKLDCGLTVKKAVYERFPVEVSDSTRDNYIEFDGEITLEGLLTAAKNDDDYLARIGDLGFTPDPTKTSGIPDCTHQLDPDNVISRQMYSRGDFILTDGKAAWIVGTVDDIDKDYIFGDDELARVKVTLTNVKYGGFVSIDLPAFYAEIVDIERID